MGEFSITALTQALETVVPVSTIAVLCDSPVDGELSSLLQIIQAEEAQTGYERKIFARSSVSFDATQNRAETSGSVSWSVAADGLSLIFDTIALIEGTTTFQGQDVTAIDGATNRYTISSNSFNNGDRVVVAARIGGTVPTAATEILTIANRTSNSVQLVDSNNQVVPVSGGVLPLRLKNANGTLRYIEPLGSQQILPGDTKAILLQLNFGRSTANVANP